MKNNNVLLFLIFAIAMPTVIIPVQLTQLTRNTVLISMTGLFHYVRYIYNQSQEIGKSAGEFEINWPKSESKSLVPKFDIKELQCTMKECKHNDLNEVVYEAKMHDKKIGEIRAFYASDKIAYLSTLKVDDKWQHKGIGQHLFKIMMKQLSIYDIDNVSMQVVAMGVSPQSDEFIVASKRLYNFYTQLGCELRSGGYFAGEYVGSINPRIYKDYVLM